MFDFTLNESIDVWTHLKNTDKPIVMYGTGNGADKIFAAFYEYGIKVSDMFMSDELFREGCEFHGFKLMRYEDVKKKYDDFIIVLNFAVFRRDMLERIKAMAEEHELVAPCVSVFGFDHFSINTLKTYENEINEAYRALYDDKSREVFINSLEYRISGNPKYLFDCQTDRDEVFQNILDLSDEEIFVDLGAFRGDTVEEFLLQTKGKYKKIYALEPDIKNYKKLLENMGTLDNAEFINKASWSEERVMTFSGGGGRNSSVLAIDGTLNLETEEIIHATDVDSVLSKSPATYIKMDVEGAEVETLEGLKFTLKTYKPKLIVSAYHKIPDVFLLPIKIRELNPDYKICLRHHPYIPDWETNYYCF